MASLQLKVGDIKVNKKMIDVAQALVVTGNVHETSRQLGVPVSTIQGWLRNNEDFNKLVDKFVEAMIKEIKLEVVASAKDAISVLNEIMKNPLIDAKERRMAAQDVLDRAGLVNKNQPKSEIKNTINYFAALPDDELDKIIELDIKDVSYVYEGDEGKDSSGEAGEVEEGSV
jgi:Fe2+ transport system protein B